MSEAENSTSHMTVTKTVTHDTYRGWSIYQGRFPEPAWLAHGPNYEAWTEDEGEWSHNGEYASASTREGLTEEIDAWFEENRQ